MSKFSKALKGLFWQSKGGKGEQQEPKPAGDADADAADLEALLGGGAEGGAGGEDEDLSDDEFSAMLMGNEHAVPSESFDPVDAESVAVGHAEDGAVTIDFSAQYDAAGIPDTDEVEQLENFLTRLDPSLPHVSKIAAAQAFLGAIGKDKSDVLADAERKIKQVHGITKAKETQTTEALTAQQAEIDALQAKIEEHKQQMQELNSELEGLRKACLQEESRLQAARVFFGMVDTPEPS